MRADCNIKYKSDPICDSCPYNHECAKCAPQGTNESRSMILDIYISPQPYGDVEAQALDIICIR